MILERTQSLVEEKPTLGIESYYKKKVEELEMKIIEKKTNLRRLEAQRNEIQQRIRRFNDHAAWVECDHKPAHLQHHGQENRPLSELQGKNVLAISAIGNPSAFLETLRDLGSKVIAGREFPDHHHYDREDLVAIREWITEHPKAECVLCTQKDLVKLQTSQIAGVPLYAVCIEMKIASGRDHFTALIDALAQ